MSANRREERRTAIRHFLEEHLETGESLEARRSYSGVEVTFGEDIPLFQKHPDLHGMLLIIERQLAETGGAFTVASLGLAVAFCFAIAKGWIAQIGPIPIRELQSWWVYAVLLVATCILSDFYVRSAQRRLFQQLKPELISEMKRAGVTRTRMLSCCEGEESLKEVRAQIQKDDGYEYLA